jgi:DNA-binding PadR family transcriptional regulator
MLKRRGENLAYHAARLLLLVAFCGKPRGKQAKALPGIEGRTLLAKLDFFLRYPLYLKKAAVIEGRDAELTDEDYGMQPEVEMYSIESRMVRYLYGPWDHIYYPALAYLIGKELIAVDKKGRTEVFRITATGVETAERIAGDDAYADLAARARTAYRVLNKYGGNGLKNFIYDNFPEVVNRDIGETI